MRQTNIFEDTMRQFSKDVSKYLKVKFIGESAVDDDGP